MGAKTNERQKVDVWTPVNRNEFLKEETSGTFAKSHFATMNKNEEPELPNQISQDRKISNEQLDE